MAEVAGARLIDVDVVRSDATEHRRRIETRPGDLPGLVSPTWAAVCDREYHAWDRPRLVLDTAGRDAGACVAELLAGVSARSDAAPAPGNQVAEEARSHGA